MSNASITNLPATTAAHVNQKFVPAATASRTPSLDTSAVDNSPRAYSNVNASPADSTASPYTHSRQASLSAAPSPAGPPRVTPRITTASSPISLAPSNPSPVGGGPASGSYVIPPRPKPGRKPATDEPASKRKAQNRESQRAFRARKAAKLTEMQDEAKETQQRHEQAMMEKEALITEMYNEIRLLKEASRRLETELAAMTRERDYWKTNQPPQRPSLPAGGDLNDWARKYSGGIPPNMPSSRQDSPARDTLGALTPLTATPQAFNTPGTLIGCGNCKSEAECACIDEISKLDSSPTFMPSDHLSRRRVSIPADAFPAQPLSNDPFADREIDFTTVFSGRGSRPDNTASANFITQSHEECGFCTDETNCLCRDQSLQLGSAMEQATNTIVGPRRPRKGRPASAPGTCDDCMRDPKKKAWCQRVAQLKRSEPGYSSSRPQSSSSSISTLDPMEPPITPGPVSHAGSANRSSIGCSDAYKLFNGRVPVDQDSMDWSSLNPHLPAVPKDTLPAIDPSRTWSALELDTAGVIATLQQTLGPLRPRQEDGPHADLVNIAESQRTGISPVDQQMNH